MPPCNCHGETTPPQLDPRTGKPVEASAPLNPPPPPLRRVGLPAPTNARTQTFTLDTSDGKTATFGSRLEAQADRARNHKGRGTITPGQ